MKRKKEQGEETPFVSVLSRVDMAFGFSGIQFRLQKEPWRNTPNEVREHITKQIIKVFGAD